MELVTGVRIHFMKSEKFKTNEIKVWLSSPFWRNTAGRVLSPHAWSKQPPPFTQLQQFREQLANLYGANFST